MRSVAGLEVVLLSLVYVSPRTDRLDELPLTLSDQVALNPKTYCLQEEGSGA